MPRARGGCASDVGKLLKGLPVLATTIVAVAVAAMIALGIWQLGRADEKTALVARYAANLRRPEMAVPTFLRADDAMLFRRARGLCLEPAGWTSTSGRDVNGRSGWRHLAWCSTGVEGPGFLADVGISNDPAPPKWRGGDVAGVLVPEPVANSLAGRLLGHAPVPRPMIVSVTAAPGLVATARPDPGEVPNNHLSYAVQWFIFAALAALIYALALRSKRRAASVNVLQPKTPPASP